MKTEKRCPKHNDGAGAILPASFFYVQKNAQGKPKLAGYCKECSKKIAMAYHSLHRDKANAAVRSARKNHPETDKRHNPSRRAWMNRDKANNPSKYRLQYWKTTIKKKYGVTSEWYEEKLREQGGRCALCPQTISLAGRRLGVDHCHRTMQIRGILCDRCNNCLERLESHDGWAERALAYLASYKTA